MRRLFNGMARGDMHVMLEVWANKSQQTAGGRRCVASYDGGSQ